MSHLHDALAEGGALKELWDHRHSRDVNESTWIDRDGDVKWITRKQPAVKGRISLDAISTEPPSTRDTMQPVKAPTAVSSWSMIACNVHGYTLAAHSGNRHTLWGETPDWMRMA